MRKSFARAAAAFALAVVCSAPAFDTAVAQSESFEAPRTASGAPDFNGVWQALNEANWGLEGHAAYAGPVLELGAAYATPPSRGFVEGGTIPYQPWAAKQRDENFAHRLERDPEVKCYLPGVPRATYMPHPFQIIQSDSHIMIAYQYRGAVRTIYMKDHKPAPVPSWMGWSNGRFEGDSLVVETTGFNGMTWFDRAGNFHDENLRVVERFTHLSPNHLMYEATIEDPTVFTRPWTIRMPLYRRVEQNAQIMEFKCMVFVEDLLYGDLAKPEQ
ncbi:MAG TPA: hypothetical protein VF329_01250 [Gammaproteobacteria bacterium]